MYLPSFILRDWDKNPPKPAVSIVRRDRLSTTRINEKADPFHQGEDLLVFLGVI